MINPIVHAEGADTGRPVIGCKLRVADKRVMMLHRDYDYAVMPKATTSYGHDYGCTNHTIMKQYPLSN